MLKIFTIAILLDLILGDPYSFPHPVKLMGKIIRAEEKIIRKKDRSPKSLRVCGFFVAIFNIGLCFFLPFLFLKLLEPSSLIHSLVSIYIIYACLAARSLDIEAKKVKKALDKGIEEGRYQLSFIVGRDTSKLSEKEIIQATIETVAENTSDGVIAPMFYMFLLGPAGGLMYKMVNTMDSTLGYKNEKYIDYGRYPAIIDDIFNYISARITGLIMGLIAIPINGNLRALRVMFRDRRKHTSPNAGYPESCVAGILGIQLGGDSVYHGKLVKKPKLGDKLRELEGKDIDRTVGIMYLTEAFLFIAYILIKLI